MKLIVLVALANSISADDAKKADIKAPVAPKALAQTDKHVDTELQAKKDAENKKIHDSVALLSKKEAPPAAKTLANTKESAQ